MATRGDYSLSEVNTGKKWADGKYIYAKTFTGVWSGSANVRQVITIPLSPQTPDNLVGVEGTVEISNAGNTMSFGATWFNTAGNTVASEAGGYFDKASSKNYILVLRSDQAVSNKGYTLKIEYTKV